MSARSEEWAPVLVEIPDIGTGMARALTRSGGPGIQNPYKQGKKYLEVPKHANSCDLVQDHRARVSSSVCI